MRKRNFKLPISDLEVPKVLGGEQRVVLHDPGDSLVSVAVEDVHLLSPRQPKSSHSCSSASTCMDGRRVSGCCSWLKNKSMKIEEILPFQHPRVMYMWGILRRSGDREGGVRILAVV